MRPTDTSELRNSQSHLSSYTIAPHLPHIHDMVSKIFSFVVAAALFVAGTQASSIPATLHRRQLTGQSIAFACFGGGGDCQCPTDNNGDSGVLINVYPGYQCAYPNGACTWDDKVGCLILVVRSCFDRSLLFNSTERCTPEYLPDQLPVYFSLQHCWWLQVPLR